MMSKKCRGEDLAGIEQASHLTDEEDMVKKRLKDLGYLG